MKGNLSVVWLVTLFFFVSLSSSAWAVIPTVTYSGTSLPPSGAGGTIANSSGSISYDSASADGTAWINTPLVAAVDVGTNPFVWTVRFGSGVSFTGTAFFEMDNTNGPGDSAAKALTVQATVIRLQEPLTGVGPNVPRPAGPFAIQLERTATQYIARLDSTNDGTFETEIGTAPVTPAARPMQIVDAVANPVIVSSISIAPPAAPPPPVPVPQVTPSASAPTMGSWGAIVMALVLLAIAGMAIRAKKVSV